jgi:hypothetical protein
MAWEFPTYRGSLPHDLVHLVVETGFGLRGALWGRIDAGADPAQIHGEAQRGPGGEDRRELLIAEGLATVRWYDPALDDEALCRDVAESCAAFGVEAPENVSPERVAGVRAALCHLRARWSGPGRRTLTLAFGADDPEGWLVALLG